MADSLGRAVLTLAVDDGAFRAGLQGARAAVQKLGDDIAGSLGGGRQQAIDKLTERIKALQAESARSLGLAGKNAPIIAALQDEIRLRQQSLQIVAQQVEREKARAAASRISVPDRAVGVAGRIGTAVAGLGIGIALQQFFRESIQGAIELESITRKLSNTLGQQGAGKALSFTKGLADELGLSFTTLSSSFGSFTAAASAARVPLEEQRDLFAAVSKAAQQLGLSNDEISGSLLALQQIASKGTVSMEELRGQLGERLPIAFGAAARGLGITQQELIKLVETGRLTSNQFFPALTKGLNELTSSTEGAPTAAQNLQKFQNQWKEAQVTFGQNVLPSVTASVEALGAALEGLGRKDIADRLGFQTGAAGALGFLSDEAIRAAESYKSTQQQFSLTNKEADRLFSNAAKNLNIRNLGLADSNTVNQVIAEYQRLAAGFREANPDRLDELSRQQAESEKIRQVALARFDAEQKILRPSEQQLKDAQALVGLKGLALASAQEELKIAELRRQVAKAEQQEQISRRSIGADGIETADVVTAAAKVEASGNALRVALLEGSLLLEEKAKDAAERFAGAVRGLRDARLNLADQQTNPEGLNRFLRPDEQFQRNRQAILSLGDELRRSLETGQGLLNAQGVGLGRDVFADVRRIFDDAVTGRAASRDGFDAIQRTIRDIQNEQSGIAGVNDAQEALTSVTSELAAVNGTLAARVQELVQKAWAVQVVVAADGTSQVYGDAVNAAL